MDVIHSLFFPKCERKRNDALLIKQWCVQTNLLALLTFLLFLQLIFIRLISECFTRWHTIASRRFSLSLSPILRIVLIFIISSSFFAHSFGMQDILIFLRAPFPSKFETKIEIQMNMTGGVISIPFFCARSIDTIQFMKWLS